MILRCRIDGLLVPAQLLADDQLLVTDGDESFVLETIEACYYEVQSATPEERQRVVSRYRLLRNAGAFGLRIDYVQ